ncbi:MAG: glycosyltransferase family 4 protein [Opitutales bacterium]
MRLTIVNGFFLPVPPVSGGSTEKTWHALGRAFAARGHEVVSISRRWSGFPREETEAGVRHLRLPGFDHQAKLSRNLFRDFRWSWRVFRALPPADIVVCHAVTLPVWLGFLKPAAGRVVVMTGRMPKGQYRYYSHLTRVLAPSELVRERVLAENPALAPLIRTTGYPIDWSLLSQNDGTAPPFLPRRDPAEGVTIGFVGRLHREKGLLLLAEALKLLHAEPGLPPWQILLCGPSDTSRGGSGGEFRSRLLSQLSGAVDLSRLHVLEPQFNERVLASIYRRIDVFCYPSLAEEGETFGVAVAEAMAAGAVPVVSHLACFRDFVRDGVNGLIFDHAGDGAAIRLAAVLRRVIMDATLRERLALQARADVRQYDIPEFADRLLADFAALTAVDPPPPRP